MSESKTSSKFDDKDGYIVLPNSEGHNCFGCSPKNSSGLQMKFHINEKRDLVVSWLSVPDHLCGWANAVHGGIISTILDEAMGWAALVILKKLVLTKSISVDYLKPIFIGQKIKVEGSTLEVQNERKGVMQACIYDESNEILARSSSAVSLFTLDSIREMGVVDEKMLGSLEQIVRMG